MKRTHLADYAVGAKIALAEYPLVSRLGREKPPARAALERQQRIHIFRVPADVAEGYDTGVWLRRGEQFRITASGRVTVDNGQTWFAPDGVVVKGPHIGGGCTEPNTRFKGKLGELVGWIGDGEPFLIDYVYEGTTKNDGLLRLAVNDTEGMYWDNEASYTVVLEVA